MYCCEGGVFGLLDLTGIKYCLEYPSAVVVMKSLSIFLINGNLSYGKIFKRRSVHKGA